MNLLRFFRRRAPKGSEAAPPPDPDTSAPGDTAAAPATNTPRLISCLGVETDLALLEHFLAHYAGLGIAPDQMHLLLNAPTAESPALGTARDRLAAFGAAPPHVWIGTYSSAEMWHRRRQIQDEVAGPRDWIVSADVDEFHSYPCPLGELFAYLDLIGANVLQGPMIDRLAPEGALAEITPDRPLPEQFPICSDAMIALGKTAGQDDSAGTLKVMLCRPGIFPGQGGHFPKPPGEAGPWPAYAHGVALAAFPRAKEAGFRLMQPALVHHYKWHAGLAARWQARLDRPQGASGPAQRYGERMLSHLDATGGRIDLSAVATADMPAPVPDWRDRMATLREQGEMVSRTRHRPGPGPARDAVGQGWRVTQLTDGSRRGESHSHSYYDLPVVAPDGAGIVAFRNTAPNRPVDPQDSVTVGIVDTVEGGFRPLAETRAWSWQQGPMAQFLPDGRIAWCDREALRMIGKIHDPRTGMTRDLPRPVYAIDPDGRYTLSLNMARLNRMRPGYGFVGGRDLFQDDPAPEKDGVWHVDLDTGASRLLLSVKRAVDFLRSRGLAPENPDLTYWFNHPKIAPDGRRFTVKLRWRRRDLQDKWTGRMGVSLTCGTDGPDAPGGDLRLLATHTSHVMWWSATRLYYWDAGRKRLSVVRDTPGEGEGVDGTRAHDLWPEIFDGNVHMRHVPERPDLAVYDTAYQPQIDLRIANLETGAWQRIATFRGHKPPRGPHRCDLHPVVSADGRRIVVTSLVDGKRQVYLVEREGQGPLIEEAAT